MAQITNDDELLEAIAFLRRVTEETQDLKRLRDSCDKKIAELEPQYREQAKEVTDYIKHIDVTSVGNFGWQIRIVHFLIRMSATMEKGGTNERVDHH